MKNGSLLLLMAVLLLAGMTGCGNDGSAPAPPPLSPMPTLAKTGQTTRFDAGDDGDLQKGVVWPDPRFTVASSGTGTVVTDNLTGLMWTHDGNAPDPADCTASSGLTMSWQEALDYVTCLNTNTYLGHSDWRLPNINELKSLINYGEADNAAWLNNVSQGFSNVQGAAYWTSTTCSPATTNAWTINMPDGQITNAPKGSAYRVWAMRNDGTGTIAVPKTGQTTSFAAGDDGDLNKGVDWPSTRFIDNGDATITDKLTNLMWTQDANAPGPADCSPSVAKSNTEALTYIDCLNTNSYLGHADWRMPNVNELASLVNREVQYPYLWLNAQGFTNVKNSWYRSSTTTASNTLHAWVVMMNNGNIFNDAIKTNPADYIWPVRDSN